MMFIMDKRTKGSRNESARSKPAGTLTLNASSEASQGPVRFPKRSGSTHPKRQRQEELLTKSNNRVSHRR